MLGRTSLGLTLSWQNSKLHFHYLTIRYVKLLPNLVWLPSGPLVQRPTDLKTPATRPLTFIRLALSN